jgi:hypothetical protein
VDLTHWDVSHVSNANKAFVNALKFAQEIGRPIFNGFTKIKCDCIGSSIFATTTCNNQGWTGIKH